MNYFIPVDFVISSNFVLVFNLFSPPHSFLSLVSFQVVNAFMEALRERERCWPYSDIVFCLGYKACAYCAEQPLSFYAWKLELCSYLCPKFQPNMENIAR